MARFAPKLCVPAFGARGRRPLEAILTLPMCGEHMAAQTADEHMTPALRAAFTMQAAGRFIPDFAAAWIEPIDLGAAEWAGAMRAVGVRH